MPALRDSVSVRRTLRHHDTHGETPTDSVCEAMVVADLMRGPLPSLPSETPIADGEAALIATGGERLLLTDAAGGVCGIVCAATLLRCRLIGLGEAQTLGDLAGRCLLTCRPTDRLEAIAPQFREARHSLAIVLDDGRAVGTVHRLDLLRWLVARQSD